MLPAASLYEVISVLIDSLVVFCKRVDYRSINYQLPHFFFLLLNTSKIRRREAIILIIIIDRLIDGHRICAIVCQR